jgi:hypothetical protein
MAPVPQTVVGVITSVEVTAHAIEFRIRPDRNPLITPIDDGPPSPIGPTMEPVPVFVRLSDRTWESVRDRHATTIVWWPGQRVRVEHEPTEYGQRPKAMYLGSTDSLRVF